MPKNAPAPSTAVATRPITVPSTTVELPELVNAEAAAKAAIETYKGFAGTIDNVDTYQFVGEELVKVKGQLNKYTRDCAALKAPYQESKRVAQNGMNLVDNYFAGVIQALGLAEKLLKTERERWESIEKRRLAEEQRLLVASQEAERQRVAEESRKRSEAAAAEAQRKLDEAAQLRRKKDQESKQRAEVLRREAETVVETAEAQNQMEQDIADISTSTQAVTRVAVRTAGVSSSERVTAEFVDLEAILRGLLDGSIPLKALRCKVDGRAQPLNGNLKAASVIELPLDWFRKEAVDLGVDGFKYPGVRAFEKARTAVRA